MTDLPEYSSRLAGILLAGLLCSACGSSSSSQPGGSGSPPSDLRFVAFQSDATNLVAGDTNGNTDIFMRDIVANTTARISLNSTSGQLTNYSALASLTPDARFMAFAYGGGPDIIPGITGEHVYVRDLQTGVIDASPILAGRTGIGGPSISANGRYVAFYSFSTTPPSNSDVFIWDRTTGAIQWASAAPGGVQGTGGNCYDPKISADGNFVAFRSLMSDLVPGDTNGVYDVFVFDRVQSTLQRVSVSSAGVQGNNISEGPSLSGDGRYVLFRSYATNLVAGDTNGMDDFFVRDRVAGTTERVSVSSSGAQGSAGGSLANTLSSISTDGRYVAFPHGSPDLVANDTNGKVDVFVRDRVAGTTVRVSVATGGVEGNGDCEHASIYPGGRWVAFQSSATNLVAGDTNGKLDIFLHDLQTGVTSRLSVSTAGVESDDDSRLPRASSP